MTMMMEVRKGQLQDPESVHHHCIVIVFEHYNTWLTPQLYYLQICQEFHLHICLNCTYVVVYPTNSLVLVACSDGSEDSEDERIMNELQNVNKKKRISSSSSSSSSKKQRRDSDDEDGDDDDDDDDEVQFVEDNYEDLETVNIIPRAKRGAAIRSGLAKGEDGKKLSAQKNYEDLGSDEEEEEF